MNPKIKLLHITSSLQMGGAERVLFELVTALDPQKYAQTVIYFHSGPYEQLLTKAGIIIIPIKGWLFRYDLVFWVRLWNAIRAVAPDQMHTLLWVANLAGRIMGRLLRIPTVAVVHNNVTQDGPIRSVVDHLTFSKRDTLIAVSPEVRDSLCSRHQWLPAQQVRVIPNGVNVDLFSHAATEVRTKRLAYGYSPEHIVIGSVGRFVPVKQYDLLLASFAAVYKQLPNVRLLLVGTGPQEKQLRELAITLEINSVVSLVIGKPAIDYYGLFDCFVMSSAQEGISLALLEAMSSSLACVVTNNKAPEHTVLSNGQDGLVVESNHPQVLANALQKLALNAELRRNLGAAAYKTVAERFTREQMIRQYDQLFSASGSIRDLNSI